MHATLCTNAVPASRGPDGRQRRRSMEYGLGCAASTADHPSLSSSTPRKWMASTSWAAPSWCEAFVCTFAICIPIPRISHSNMHAAKTQGLQGLWVRVCVSQHFRLRTFQYHVHLCSTASRSVFNQRGLLFDVADQVSVLCWEWACRTPGILRSDSHLNEVADQMSRIVWEGLGHVAGRRRHSAHCSAPVSVGRQHALCGWRQRCEALLDCLL